MTGTSFAHATQFSPALGKKAMTIWQVKKQKTQVQRGLIRGGGDSVQSGLFLGAFFSLRGQKMGRLKGTVLIVPVLHLYVTPIYVTSFLVFHTKVTVSILLSQNSVIN